MYWVPSTDALNAVAVVLLSDSDSCKAEPTLPGTVDVMVTTPTAEVAVTIPDRAGSVLIHAAKASAVSVTLPPILNSGPVAPDAFAVNTTLAIDKVSSAVGAPVNVTVAVAWVAPTCTVSSPELTPAAIEFMWSASPIAAGRPRGASRALSANCAAVSESDRTIRVIVICKSLLCLRKRAMPF